MDRLVRKRLDLAEKVRLGELPVTTAIREMRREELRLCGSHGRRGQTMALGVLCPEKIDETFCLEPKSSHRQHDSMTPPLKTNFSQKS